MARISVEMARISVEMAPKQEAALLEQSGLPRMRVHHNNNSSHAFLVSDEKPVDIISKREIPQGSDRMLEQTDLERMLEH